MAYPPTPTLTAVNCPVPKAFTGIFEPAADGPLVSPAFTQGGFWHADDANKLGAHSDAVGRAGGGIWGVIPGADGLGCNLSTVSGLTLDIAEGAVMIDGYLHVPAQSVTLTNSVSRVYIFISQAGAIGQVNASLTPPAGAHVLLGSCVTNSPAGSITGIDFSGVVYLNGPVAHRFTADASLPADAASLPPNISFINHSTADLFLFDGDAYWHISGGSAGTLAVADGGTGATTAADARVNLGTPQLGVYTHNPSNGTNTLTATQSNNSVIILTGGSASAQFTLELTVDGSPTVRAGHTWDIINKTSYGVLIVRNGSGLANCFLGQGSANDQRGRFVYSGSEVHRVAKDYPSYISRVITSTLTATRGQVEAGFLVTGAQTTPQTIEIPNTGGYEGQVTTHQADVSNYPLTIKTNGETEPDAITTLLPGEIQQVVQDAAGRHWRVGRPYMREVIIDFASNANLTLSASQARAYTLRIQDTTVVLSAGRDVIWAAQQIAGSHRWHCVNETLQTLTFKNAGGGGVAIAAGMAADIRSDGTNMKRCSADVAP